MHRRIWVFGVFGVSTGLVVGWLLAEVLKDWGLL